jgi:hypothetical protein
MRRAPGRVISKRIFAALILLALLALAAGAAVAGRAVAGAALRSQPAAAQGKRPAETYQLIEFYSPF